jgi:mono/diheme cytochrome c family protein
MWNHAPEMWTTPGNRETLATKLTSAESADLFAYFYSVLYFAPPADAERGRVFFKKNCAVCHSGEPGSGAALPAWKGVANPVIWAERMWNHSAEMNDVSIRKGLPLPRLSSQDVADLLVYLRGLPSLHAESTVFDTGEPEQGMVVFERSCESCHSFGPGPGKKVDLLRRRAPSTVTGYIAAMWNHAALMRGSDEPHSPPKLERGDMSNLIAFLFSQSYFSENGNSVRGRRVFESKNCSSCHEDRRKDTGAPDLTEASDLYSPITLTAAAWNHGPAMFQKMQQSRIFWPEFHGSEMTDLITYLNSQVTKRIALGRN